jgi:hypothetical protein
MTEVYATPRSDNRKTGDIPQVWIGQTWASARASCDAVACPLRPWLTRPKGSMTCYAWGGTSAIAFASVLKKAATGTDRTLEHAIAKRSKKAQAIRVGAIGDPGVMPWGWWYRLRRLAKAAKLDVLAYTHADGWRKRPDLAGHTMASCDSLAEAVEAHALGFRAAIATRDVAADSPPITLADGRRAVVCPAISAATRNREVTCNTCRMCDGSKLGPDIIFPDHGPSVQGIKRHTNAPA